MNRAKELILKLKKERTLILSDYKYLIDKFSPEISDFAAKNAAEVRKAVYGRDIYIRGLIEISNICKNNCFYCGIRKDNKGCDRYRLNEKDIMSAAESGYSLGFRTFVLQGGEDGFFTDEFLILLIKKLKKTYPDCAVTLSLGERSKESYSLLFSAGADRYLLRHETADREHYKKLHPETMSFENRMECLKNLKEIGFQVGCGFMVGSPYQTNDIIAKDLKFIEEFSPDMCGIGPFITHKATPFGDMTSGSLDLTLYLLSLIRLIKPNILLPATTALGTIDPKGREKGILAGANVVMPNLSPISVREKYELYDNKVSTGEEAAEYKENLSRRMEAIGYKIVTAKGDIIKKEVM